RDQAVALPERVDVARLAAFDEPPERPHVGEREGRQAEADADRHDASPARRAQLDQEAVGKPGAGSGRTPTLPAPPTGSPLHGDVTAQELVSPAERYGIRSG